MSEENMNDDAMIEDSTPEVNEVEESAIEEHQEAETTEESAGITQEVFNREIGKKVAKLREEERQKLALQQELEQLRAQTQPAEPEIPPIPDYYDFESDEQYQAAIKAREAAVVKKAQHDQQQAIAQAQAFQQQQQQAIQVQQALVDAEAKTVKAAKDQGITEQELMEGANVMAAYGLSGEIGLGVMSDPDGAQIIKYLGANPMECEKIANMHTLQIGSYLETNVRPKAKALKPKASNAPKPPTDVSGGGQDPSLGRYAHIKGVKFE